MDKGTIILGLMWVPFYLYLVVRLVSKAWHESKKEEKKEK